MRNIQDKNTKSAVSKQRLTPYQMRGEMLFRAMEFYRKKYECELHRYKEVGGEYPTYPTIDECIKYAERMKTFVDNNKVVSN